MQLELCSPVPGKSTQWPQDLLPGADGCWGWGCVFHGLDSTTRQQGCLLHCVAHSQSHDPALWGSLGTPSLQHQGGLPTNLERNAWSSIPDPSEGPQLTSPSHSHRWKLRRVSVLPRLCECAVPGKWWSLLSGILPHWSGERKGPLLFSHPRPEPLVPM